MRSAEEVAAEELAAFADNCEGLCGCWLMDGVRETPAGIACETCGRLVRYRVESRLRVGGNAK